MNTVPGLVLFERILGETDFRHHVQTVNVCTRLDEGPEIFNLKKIKYVSEKHGMPRLLEYLILG